MKLIQHYVRFEKTEAIESFVSEKLAHLQRHFFQHANPKVTLKYSMENSPNQAGVDSFSCEVLIEGKPYKALKVKKKSTNLYEAINHALDSTDFLLSKIHDKISNQKRHNKKLSLMIPSLTTP